MPDVHNYKTTLAYFVVLLYDSMCKVLIFKHQLAM